MKRTRSSITAHRGILQRGPQGKIRSLATILLFTIASWCTTSTSTLMFVEAQVSTADCISELEANDSNGNGQLNQVEFMNFLVRLDPYNNGCPSLASLSDFLPGGMYYTLFLKSSCTCLKYDEDQTCCLTPAVRLNNDGSLYSDGYYEDICALVSEQLQGQCQPEPGGPTQSPATAVPTAAVIARTMPPTTEQKPGDDPPNGDTGGGVFTVTSPTAAPTASTVAETPAAPTAPTNDTTEDESPQQDRGIDGNTGDTTQNSTTQDGQKSNVNWKVWLFIPILFVLSSWLVLFFMWENRKRSKRRSNEQHQELGDNNNNKMDPESLDPEEQEYHDGVIDDSGLPPPPPPAQFLPSALNASEASDSDADPERYQYDPQPAAAAAGTGAGAADENSNERSSAAFVFQGPMIFPGAAVGDSGEDSDQIHVFVEGSEDNDR